jgi:aryl-alcohol dehydrogenase-like predicted oxidoreductase
MSKSLVGPDPRKLGSRSVGALSFGCWRFTSRDIGEAGALLDTALELGMNLVDTADVYGLDWNGTGFGSVEELLGRVIADRPQRREAMVLATKGGIIPGIPYDSSPAALRSALEASLRRLGVEHVDLYQVHRPDMFTHPEVLADTLRSFIDSGRVSMVGVSNVTVAQTRALRAHLGDALVSTQPEFSAAHLDPLRDGTFDLCMELDITPLAWSPLGGGRLLDDNDASVRPELRLVLDELAQREGVNRACIAIAFVLAHPARPIAIVGTQQPERLRDLQRSLDVRLDRADLYRIIVASEGTPLP